MKTDICRILILALCAVLVLGLFAGVPAMTIAASATSVMGYTENFETDTNGDGLADGWTKTGDLEANLSTTSYDGAAVADGTYAQHAKKGASAQYLWSPKIVLEEGMKYSLRYFFGHSGAVTVYLWHYSEDETKTVTANYDYSGWKPTMLERGHDALALPEGYTYSQVAFRIGSGEIWVDSFKFAPECDHNWIPATSTTPKTCSVCGATEGGPVNMTYAEGFETDADANGLADGWTVNTQPAEAALVPEAHNGTSVADGTYLQYIKKDAAAVYLYSPQITLNENLSYGLEYYFGHSGVTNVYVWHYSSDSSKTVSAVYDYTGWKPALVLCEHEPLALPEGYTYTQVAFRIGSGDIWVDALQFIPVCDHIWNDATCTAPLTCSICGTTEGSALGHTEEAIEGKDATCTEAGVSAGSKCTVCGEIVTAQQPIEALGHAWVDANCSAPKTCSVCGITEGEPSGEHAWVDATCTTAKTCSACGTVEGEALGHTLTAVEAKEATTEAEGNKAYWTCECGKWFADAEGTTEITDQDSVVIPKLPEDLDVPVTGDVMLVSGIVLMLMSVVALVVTKTKLYTK